MFNLSGSEIAFLVLIGLIVLGPEKLPDAVRRFTKAYNEFKKMATGFQGEMKQAFDEPMRELKGTADAVRKAAGEIGTEVDKTAKAATSSVGATPPARRDAGLNFGNTKRKEPSSQDAVDGSVGEGSAGDDTANEQAQDANE